jgi:hypothetical protein
VSAAYNDHKQLIGISILNVARMEKFSSGRSIRDTAQTQEDYAGQETVILR